METIAEPFIGTEAVASGLVSRRKLHRQYESVYRNVYLAKGQELTAVTRAKAAWLWAGRDATLAGLSASAMHGSLWIDPAEPAELIRRGDEVDGIRIHRDTLVDDEICVIAGMPITTPARTAYDLGRRNGLLRAVMRLDALANSTGLQRSSVDMLTHRHKGARGIVQLRRAVDLMDGGAESPQETRTRLLLIAAGFPRPQTQIVVCDQFGYFIGRIDMGWRKWKVGVEYDGPQHWTNPEVHARDIDRLAELQAQGWIIIRVSRDILRYRPDVFLLRVREAMRAAGWPHCDQIRLDARISLESVA
jgi:uncharacterized protein DUF559